MLKKLICTALVLGLGAGQAWANDTAPGDVVNVNASAYRDDATVIYEKTYTKPWNQIKLSKQTHDKIKRAINAVKKEKSFYSNLKYRVISVVIINDDLSRFVAMSNYGDVFAVDFSDDMFCSITVDCQNSLHACSTCVNKVY